MQSFDQWLKSRLEAAGCFGGEIEDNDLHAAIERFQLARGLRVSGIADDDTLLQLRQQKSANPDSALTIFQIIPPANGSIYAGASA